MLASEKDVAEFERFLKDAGIRCKKHKRKIAFKVWYHTRKQMAGVMVEVLEGIKESVPSNISSDKPSY